MMPIDVYPIVLFRGARTNHTPMDHWHIVIFRKCLMPFLQSFICRNQNHFLHLLFCFVLFVTFPTVLHEKPHLLAPLERGDVTFKENYWKA
mgnify:CR=1 FL=1